MRKKKAEERAPSLTRTRRGRVVAASGRRILWQDGELFSSFSSFAPDDLFRLGYHFLGRNWPCFRVCGVCVCFGNPVSLLVLIRATRWVLQGPSLGGGPLVSSRFSSFVDDRSCWCG